MYQTLPYDNTITQLLKKKGNVSVLYLHRNLSTIFPPHMVASIDFMAKTVSFPWPSLQHKHTLYRAVTCYSLQGRLSIALN